jgi:hypothetical protein
MLCGGFSGNPFKLSAFLFWKKTRSDTKEILL